MMPVGYFFLSFGYFVLKADLSLDWLLKIFSQQDQKKKKKLQINPIFKA